MSHLTEAGWESVHRALAFARADDERRAQAGMRKPEEYPSLLHLHNNAVRHFFCHIGYNTVPEYRVYGREFAIAYTVGVLSCDPISSHRLGAFRVICGLKEVQNINGAARLELQAHCWGRSRDNARWKFEPREETALRLLKTLRSCLRPHEVWKSIYWLDEPSGCFSVDYPGQLTPAYLKANCAQRWPFTMLKIDDISGVRERARYVTQFVFDELPIAG